MKLESVLAEAGTKESQQLALFAFLNLGVIESIASGMMTASEAVRLVYNAENCQFVREHFRKPADKIMSHGVQLPDLFDALPVEEAHRELHRELEVMRGLCLKLLEKKQQAA